MTKEELTKILYALKYVYGEYAGKVLFCKILDLIN